jgi:mRNA interferase RelE/StbE
MPGIKYRIEFTEKSKENLHKFPKNIQETILKAIQQRLTVGPEIGKPLVREWKNHRRLRVGDYRIIYKIIDDRLVVLIVEIDNRRDIY